jgi:hypothetical protein
MIRLIRRIGPICQIKEKITRKRSRFLGGYAEGVTPVPIPNTEVKPLRADGTAWVTVWESRSPPGFYYKMPRFSFREAGLFAFVSISIFLAFLFGRSAMLRLLNPCLGQ